MKNRIREYLDYRRNRRTAKRELVRLAATALTALRRAVDTFRNDNEQLISLISSIAALSPEELEKLLRSVMTQNTPTNNADAEPGQNTEAENAADALR